MESWKDTEERHSSCDADRSLPIHCIVEEVTSLEAARLADCCHDDRKWNREVKSCVVLPAGTRMEDLVATVLNRLGYPQGTAASAMGSILIRNWKALSLEAISPGPKMTVGDILGELSTLATLRIQVLRPMSSLLQEMKDNLLSLLVKHNRGFLASSGCPLDLLSLSKPCEDFAIEKKHCFPEPSEEIRQRFESWIRHQMKEMSSDGGVFSETSVPCTNNNRMAYTPEPATCLEKLPPEPKFLGHKETSNYDALERSKQFVPTKTRMRTSFDPELELPKLHQWYMENPHPTRQQIYEYVEALNSLESRKGRKKLDVNNVVYWFKNARAAQKRTECKGFCALPTPGGNNRCNVLKIPLGKTSSSITSDDDETSMASETNEYHPNGETRCQQMNSWTSHRENVLQMSPRKNEEESHPVTRLKEERLSDDEGDIRDRILSIAEDTVDHVEHPEGRDSTQDKSREDRLDGYHKERREDGKRNRVDPNEDLPSVKTFTSSKENNGISNRAHEAFLSGFKSGFSVAPNSILGHSFMYMTQYMSSKQNNLSLSSEERRKRNRTFIDPVTEVPRLEQWFRLSTHPSHNLIARYTEELNAMPYRRKFPKLETKNVQFWFKNRRAKNKRLNYSETRN